MVGHINDTLQKNDAPRSFEYVMRAHYKPGHRPADLPADMPFEVYVVYSDQINEIVTGKGANEKLTVIND